MGAPRDGGCALLSCTACLPTAPNPWNQPESGAHGSHPRQPGSPPLQQIQDGVFRRSAQVQLRKAGGAAPLQQRASKRRRVLTEAARIIADAKADADVPAPEAGAAAAAGTDATDVATVGKQGAPKKGLPATAPVQTGTPKVGWDTRLHPYGLWLNDALPDCAQRWPTHHRMHGLLCAARQGCQQGA